ncbi:extracellular solute-binding protein [Actinoplanes sp. NPDC049802]|uniref:extracellular solute-binding protein n=1 Tax=Actinoplanes sp. NPDC049802 TaxID=3154742 RepID=UPI0033F6AD72
MTSAGRRRALLAGAVFVAGALAGAAILTAVDRWRGGPPAELVIVSGVEDGEGAARQTLIDLWNRTHPDRPARIHLVAGSADEQHDAMVRFARGEVAVEADILNLDVTAVAEFAEFRYIAEWPATDTPRELLGTLLRKPRESCYYGGRLWSLPFNTDAGVLFAQRRLLGQQTPTAPTAYTWDDIVARGQGLPAKDDKPTAAYAGQLQDYEGLTVNTLEALWAVEKERTGAVAATPLGVSTDPAIWSEAVNRLFGPPGRGRVVDARSTAYQEADTIAAFLDDQILFMRNWPVAYRSLVEGSDLRASAAAGEIGMTPLPGPAVLGGQNLAVVAGSRHADDARDLIEFLASEPSQRLLMQVGGYAAATSATYDRAEIRATHPYAETVRTAVLDSRQRPATPYYPRFSEEIRNVVAEIRADGGKVPADLERRLRDASEGRLPPR